MVGDDAAGGGQAEGLRLAVDVGPGGPALRRARCARRVDAHAAHGGEVDHQAAVARPRCRRRCARRRAPRAAARRSRAKRSAAITSAAPAQRAIERRAAVDHAVPDAAGARRSRRRPRSAPRLEPRRATRGARRRGASMAAGTTWVWTGRGNASPPRCGRDPGADLSRQARARRVRRGETCASARIRREVVRAPVRAAPLEHAAAPSAPGEVQHGAQPGSVPTASSRWRWAVRRRPARRPAARARWTRPGQSVARPTATTARRRARSAGTAAPPRRSPSWAASSPNAVTLKSQLASRTARDALEPATSSLPAASVSPSCEHIEAIHRRHAGSAADAAAPRSIAATSSSVKGP